MSNETEEAKKKQEAIYSEDDWKARVEILEDNSDDKWERYTLKVIETLNVSRIYNPTEGGEEFDVTHKKGCAYGGMWHLEISA